MDHSQPNNRLSEISHLFLSDVRDKTPGGERPKRLPPGAPPGSFRGDVSIDLTPEEFAKVFGGEGNAPAKPAAAFKPVRAVIAHHLGEIMADRVRDLGTMLGARTGVIYADAANIRVCCIDRSTRGSEHEPEIENLDARKLEEVLVELDQDITNWLIVLPDPRQAAASTLLRRIKHWTLLSGVDHDSVVAGYRTIKGLCESAKPSIAVAVYGATDDDELHKTYHKLASVCEQFLHVQVDLFGATEPSEAGEGCVMAAADNSTGEAAHWHVLNKLVQNAGQPVAIETNNAAPAEPKAAVAAPVMVDLPAKPPAMVQAPEVKPMSIPTPLKLTQASDQIIDLPNADTAPASILAAIVRGGGEWVESPVKAPACPEAIVAVSRDHHLVLLAVAKQGLNELRSIATAYRWLTENRELVAMALPQFAIDAHSMPRLKLLIDHADTSADALAPLLMTGNVVATAYRTLRWGEKTGLLLEAA